MEEDLRTHLQEMETRIAASCEKSMNHHAEVIARQFERLEQKIDLTTLRHDRELRDRKDDDDALWAELNHVRNVASDDRRDAAVTKGKVAGFSALGGGLIAAAAEAFRRLAGGS